MPLIPSFVDESPILWQVAGEGVDRCWRLMTSSAVVGALEGNRFIEVRRSGTYECQPTTREDYFRLCNPPAEKSSTMDRASVIWSCGATFMRKRYFVGRPVNQRHQRRRLTCSARRLIYPPLLFGSGKVVRPRILRYLRLFRRYMLDRSALIVLVLIGLSAECTGRVSG